MTKVSAQAWRKRVAASSTRCCGKIRSIDYLARRADLRFAMTPCQLALRQCRWRIQARTRNDFQTIALIAYGGKGIRLQTAVFQ
jgi:hypothetical protein